MGACEGVLDYDCQGGQKFTGPGTRRWSCWVVEEQRNYTLERAGKLKSEESEMIVTSTEAILGAAPSDSIMGAFTPGVTTH